MSTDWQVQKIMVQKGIEANKTITFVTYVLTDTGEKTLRNILTTILAHHDREDLLDIVYTSAKELIVNAVKANLKRAMFRRMNLDIHDQEEYEMGMRYFRNDLSEEKLKKYQSTFKELRLPVTATFYYSEHVLNIKVKNSFPLLAEEERRIRDKFSKAASFTSLFEFFMQHGDDSEGAGLGLVLVGTLLDQSGVDRHAFTLYSSQKYNETIAKLEIPLNEKYIPKRTMFQMELQKRGVSPDDLRKDFAYNYKAFSVRD